MKKPTKPNSYLSSYSIKNLNANKFSEINNLNQIKSKNQFKNSENENFGNLAKKHNNNAISKKSISNLSNNKSNPDCSDNHLFLKKREGFSLHSLEISNKKFNLDPEINKLKMSTNLQTQSNGESKSSKVKSEKNGFWAKFTGLFKRVSIIFFK